MQPSVYPWLAGLAFALLWTGFLLRHGPRHLHVAAMCAGMAVDLSLVLVLEFTRDAVATAMSFTLGPWQLAHVGASTLAVALYAPVFVLGWQRWRRPGASVQLRTWHRRLGYAALFFRTVGFLCMFSIVGRNGG